MLRIFSVIICNYSSSIIAIIINKIVYNTFFVRIDITYIGSLCYYD